MAKFIEQFDPQNSYKVKSSIEAERSLKVISKYLYNKFFKGDAAAPTSIYREKTSITTSSILHQDDSNKKVTDLKEMKEVKEDELVSPIPRNPNVIQTSSSLVN